MTLIERLVQENKFLEQFKGTSSLRELCRHMTLQTFQDRQLIIKEGEIGDTFYIIHSGKCSIVKSFKADSGSVI